MKIAHISDIHCDSTKGSYKKIENVLKSIKNKKVDHVVITGDLSSKGLEAEFAMVNELFNKYGLDSSDKLTVIPGNHDMFPELFNEEDWEEKIEETCLEELPQLLKKAFRIISNYRNYSRGNYYSSINRFYHNYKYTLENIISLGPNKYPFPFIKLLENDIALICIDSNKVYPTMQVSFFDVIESLGRMIWGDRDWIDESFDYSDNPICCNGWIEIKDIKKVFAHPSLRGKKKVVLLHHYLYKLEEVLEYQTESFGYYMRIWPRSLNAFLEHIKKQKVDVVLHGHWHISETYKHGNIRIVNSGDSIHTGWHLIDFTKPNLRVQKVIS
ncbi:MAG TPA: metallophosphoesterase [Ignavibacteriaceae bacterium]|nr:metallophosphoesterase [Ignavibacteriaceae bacterium]